MNSADISYVIDFTLIPPFSLENDKIEPASSPPLAFNSPSLGHPDHVKFNVRENSIRLTESSKRGKASGSARRA